MKYTDTLRCKRYEGLSHLLMLLVRLNLKNYTTMGTDIDLFHKNMGTPENEG